ncbi:major capsid protein [Acidaminococcus sp. LBK-2]|uniref:major capsid protein n=1 Tax=Acidaminococcus sp. LBK-2 TaxID=3456956 RepID=UPI003FA4D03F
MIGLKDTVSLMSAVERFKAPASLLLDTFFPIIPETATTSTIEVQLKTGERHLAPFVTRGGKAVELARNGFDDFFYKPPMMAPSRVVDPEMLNDRGFGENFVSTKTPAQRAAEIQARDLADLQASIINRKNKMAADLLTTGKYDIKGYADDGKLTIIDTVDFNFTQKVVPTTTWDKAGATIYDDIKAASLKIQEASGMVPTVMIVGKNVAGYLLGNDQIMKWMGIPSTANLSMFNIAPRIVSPQVSFVGRIPALNLEVYSYAESYMDDDGKMKGFIGDDDVILGIPGRGRQYHGAVNLLNDAGTGYITYAAPYVPYYNGNKESQEMRLTMYCRCLVAPECITDFAVIKVKGE